VSVTVSMASETPDAIPPSPPPDELLEELDEELLLLLDDELLLLPDEELDELPLLELLDELPDESLSS